MHSLKTLKWNNPFDKTNSSLYNCSKFKGNIFKMVTLRKIPEIDVTFIFFKYKSLILFLNFEFSTSFCQHLSVIVFDLCHLFRKKKRGCRDSLKKYNS
jgi:hypothetical protein